MKLRMILGGAITALLLVSSPATAQLSTSTHITFDGSPFSLGQSIHGLTYRNVLFEFFVDGVASGDAQVAPGPGGLTFFSDPNAVSGPTGPSSRLLMTFLNPAWYFEFSLARSVSYAHTDWWASSADVTVFGGFGQRTTTMNLWTEPGNNDWTVGEFTEDPDHDTNNYLTQVEIAFSGDGGDTFLLDEIEVEHQAMSVPEPSLWFLLISGLLPMIGVSLRRKFADQASGF